MKWGLWVLGALAVGALVFGSCQYQRANAAETTRDSALAVSALEAERDSLLAVAAARDAARADSIEQVNDSLGRVADRLTALLRRPKPPIPTPDSTASDSARYWRGVAEGLQVDLLVAAEALDARTAEVGGLRAQVAAQQAAAAKFRAAYEGERDRANGLEVALRKMPTGCAKVPLLGIAMPKVGPGFSLTLHGVAPAIAIIVPLGGC